MRRAIASLLMRLARRLGEEPADVREQEVDVLAPLITGAQEEDALLQPADEDWIEAVRMRARALGVVGDKAAPMQVFASRASNMSTNARSLPVQAARHVGTSGEGEKRASALAPPLPKGALRGRREPVHGGFASASCLGDPAKLPSTSTEPPPHLGEHTRSAPQAKSLALRGRAEGQAGDSSIEQGPFDTHSQSGFRDVHDSSTEHSTTRGVRPGLSTEHQHRPFWSSGPIDSAARIRSVEHAQHSGAFHQEETGIKRQESQKHSGDIPQHGRTSGAAGDAGGSGAPQLSSGRDEGRDSADRVARSGHGRTAPLPARAPGPAGVSTPLPNTNDRAAQWRPLSRAGTDRRETSESPRFGSPESTDHDRIETGSWTARLRDRTLGQAFSTGPQGSLNDKALNSKAPKVVDTDKSGQILSPFAREAHESAIRSPQPSSMRLSNRCAALTSQSREEDWEYPPAATQGRELARRGDDYAATAEVSETLVSARDRNSQRFEVMSLEPPASTFSRSLGDVSSASLWPALPDELGAAYADDSTTWPALPDELPRSVDDPLRRATRADTASHTAFLLAEQRGERWSA